VARSVRSAVPDPCQRGHTDPTGSPISATAELLFIILLLRLMLGLGLGLGLVIGLA